MEDRRRHQRYGGSRQMEFVAKYENKNIILGAIRDFSRSGISFNSKDRLNKENEINLDLQISGMDQKVPASVQILWSRRKFRGYAYGAIFINISPENKFDIMDLLYQEWRKNLKVDSLLS